MSRRAAVPPKRVLIPKFIEKTRVGQPSKALKKCRHVEADDAESFRYRDCRPTSRVVFQLPYQGDIPQITVEAQYEDYIVLNVDDSVENVLEVSVKVARGQEQFVRYDAERSRWKKVVTILADGSPVVFLHFGDFRDKLSGKRKSSPNAAMDAVFSKRPRRFEVSFEDESAQPRQPADDDPAASALNPEFAADPPEEFPESGDSDLGHLAENMSPAEVDPELEAQYLIDSALPNLPVWDPASDWSSMNPNNADGDDAEHAHHSPDCSIPIPTPEHPAVAAPGSQIFNASVSSPHTVASATSSAVELPAAVEEPERDISSVESLQPNFSFVAADWIKKHWSTVMFSIVLLLALLLAWSQPSPPPLVHSSSDFPPILALPPLPPVSVDSLKHEISLAERRFLPIQLWDSHLRNTTSPIFCLLTNTSNQGSDRLNQLVTAARLHNDIACSILKTRRTPVIDHAIKNFERAHDLIWHAAAINSPSDGTNQGEPLAMAISLHAVRQLLVNSTTSPQLWTTSEDRKAEHAALEVAKLAHVTLGTYSVVLSLRTDINDGARSELDSNVKANLSELRALRTFQSDDKVFVIFKWGPDEVTAELCSVNCWSDSWITRPWSFTLFSERKDDCYDRFN